MVSPFFGDIPRQSGDRWDNRDVEVGWCSHCLNRTEHRIQERTWTPGLWRNTYTCLGCNRKTSPCMNECGAAAKGGEFGGMWDNHYCSLCDGEIFSWESSQRYTQQFQQSYRPPRQSTAHRPRQHQQRSSGAGSQPTQIVMSKEEVVAAAKSRIELLQDCLANSDGELDTPFLAEVLHSIEESKKDFQGLMERTEGEAALTELLEVFQNLEASTESYNEMQSASTAARAAAPEAGVRGQSGGGGEGEGGGGGQDGAAQGGGSGGGWSAEVRAEFNQKVKEAIRAGSSQQRVKSWEDWMRRQKRENLEEREESRETYMSPNLTHYSMDSSCNQPYPVSAPTSLDSAADAAAAAAAASPTDISTKDQSASDAHGAAGGAEDSQDARTGAGDDLDNVAHSDDVGTRTSLLGGGGEASAGGEEVVKKRKGDLEEEAAMAEALAASVAIAD